MYLISVVIPVYKAEKIVDTLIDRLTKSLDTITSNYEVILVEDGSPDLSWDKIAPHCNNNAKIKGIKLSRNFGQHHAITAGLDHAEGEWIVVMDCDLQDRPEEISNLYNKALEGYDIVFARRVNRKDNFNKKLSSIFFYKLFSYLSGIEQDGTIANFGIYNKKVINAFNQMREPMRAFSPMIKWLGFKKTTADIKHDTRFEGKSSYSWSKLMNLALDISIAYSDKPLKLTIKLGLLISLSAIIYVSYIFILWFNDKITLSGYASIIASIWFLSGAIIFTLGILGLYVGKALDGIKNRPLYLVDKKIN